MSRPRLSSAAVTATISALLTSTLFAMPASAEEMPEPKVDNTVRTAPEQQPTDRFIVKFKETAGASSAARGKAFGVAAKDLGVSVKELRTISTGANVVQTGAELNADQADEFIADLEANPAVEYAEVDTLASALAAAPNDPFYNYQWHYTQVPHGLDIQPAWDTSTGAGVVVAVIDSGIVSHDDLDANILPGYDMMSDPAMARDGGGRDSNPRDEGTYGDGINCAADRSSWHGSHVAGTIAAATNNGEGIAGVAPSAKVIPIRALGRCGSGYISDIIDGITWASGGTVANVPANANPAKVINLSLGGKSACSISYQNAINAAVSRGSVVIAAAGNAAEDTDFYSPASCNNVITVGATGPTGDAAYYSNWGTPVDVSAPGGDDQYGGEGTVLSTVNAGSQTPIDGEGSYAFMQGTSMATPHVAGLAALMVSANPSLTPAKIEELLKGTTKPVNSCWYPCGTGIVNAPAAVAAAVLGEIPPAPAPIEPVTAGELYIDGVFQVGETLTARAENWGPAPVAMSYQWFVGGASLPASTSDRYTLQPADLGKNIRIVATGAKEGYESDTRSVTTFETVRPGTLTAPAPTISGTSAVGETLTVAAGAWAPAPVTLTYQWLRNGAAISGATAVNYPLVAADLGAAITVKVTGTKTGYATATAASAPTAAVAEGNLTAPIPTISGTAKVGEELTATPGTWPRGTTLSYQWMRSGQPIDGATAQTYLLGADDLAKMIAVRVTGSKAGHGTATATSEYTSGIAWGTLNGPVPTISGTAKVGETVAVTTGTWTEGAELFLQWTRDGVDIHGATVASYTLKPEDAGTRIGVWVIARKSGYVTSSKQGFLASPVSRNASNDFNGDGTTDVLARDTAGKLWLYKGNGKGGWLGRVQVGSGWQGFTAILTPGDFNGDGNPDVIGRDSRGGFHLYPGNGQGGWKTRVTIGSGWQGFTDLTTPGDFSGDGNVDVMARSTTGALYLYKGNGKGGWLGKTTIGSGWNGFNAILGSGDFNGDGNSDVMAWDSRGALSLYKGNGKGSWLGKASIGSGWQGFTALVTPGDFNGDGNVDVLARDKAGALWLYKGNGKGGWLGRVQAGSGWNIMNSLS
ncbi:hypothetical protein ASH00_16125 [Arthrobacter sp. Soil782]|uniref:S8 family serine peptidase n=1 Tax=Arthrobacter sp. Soil782 TaxID=1736410 RepID=UPI0006FF4516|nr:S8 family serine peptidase [Arthrobacter sp. Soil782]KRF07071.1 hypothetical protein ASH00_16125 [Arthrobacter sp. Soil782]